MIAQKCDGIEVSPRMYGLMVRKHKQLSELSVSNLTPDEIEYCVAFKCNAEKAVVLYRRIVRMEKRQGVIN